MLKRFGFVLFIVSLAAIVGCGEISGNIEKDGVGRSGVTVELSGKSSTTAITDATGQYIFENLQNGDYTITPLIEECGSVTPDTHTVAISLTSQKQTADFEMFDLQYDGDFIIENGNDILSLEGYSSVQGNLTIMDEPSDSNDLSTPVGLECLTEITGDLIITGNPALGDLQGLDNIQTIGGDLTIAANNPELVTLGLDSLESVDGDKLTIAYNLYLCTYLADELVNSISHPNATVTITGNKVCTQTWYPDCDDDNFGDTDGVSIEAVSQPPADPCVYVSNNADCDDDATGINPGATEIPDNDIDENCDTYDENPDLVLLEAWVAYSAYARQTLQDDNNGGNAPGAGNLGETWTISDGSGGTVTWKIGTLAPVITLTFTYNNYLYDGLIVSGVEIMGTDLGGTGTMTAATGQQGITLSFSGVLSGEIETHLIITEQDASGGYYVINGTQYDLSEVQ